MRDNGLIFLNLANLPAQKTQGLLRSGADFGQFPFFSAEQFLSLGLSDDEAGILIEIRQSGEWETELKAIEKNKVTIITFFDESYPLLLKEIACPPPVLYVKGNSSVLNEFSLAIVGSRTATDYGVNMACEFARKLAALGVVIVSGLARGIDTAAHTGAMVNKTVAVLGSGLLDIYPRENRRLAQMIMANGAVVSEFPLNTAPLKDNFPRRNRIVSGLSKGTLVVEAAAKSGALITANFALEQNREVFALPGKPDDFFSEGANILIQNGAKLVQNLDDILMEFNLCPQPN
jgi:DNA processing protein